jgi:hypothetical protein
MIQHRTVHQVHLLRSPRAPPHQLSIQKISQRARLLRHHRRKLQRPLQDILLPLQHLLEQTPEMLRIAWEDVAGSKQVHSIGVPNQAWQKECRIRLHGDAPARKDEAVFGLCVCNPDGRREGHGHSQAHSGAIHSDDGGLAAPVNGEIKATASGVYLVGCSLSFGP